jgi:putative drug exporter of the RND superfamily
MGRLRSVAGVPAGRWSKWAVVAFWLVVVALAGPLAGKLTSAEQNEARNWLPASAESTQVLSFAASLGVSALVFEHPFGFAGADTSFPLFVFVFLVALGIDYNIFLMTRVREEAQRRGPRHGALAGLAATGGVITSAGLVLAGTFAVLGTLPVTALTELGFAVAFGILLDTILVRSVLVTALNLDLGRWMWWPGRLACRPAARPAAPEHEIPPVRTG